MLKKTSSPKEQKIKKYEKKMKAKEIEFLSKVDEDVQNSFVDDSEEDNEKKFTIPDELLPSLNAYQRESITTPPSATREEPTDEHLNEKKSESVVEDHCQTNKDNVGLSSKSELHEEVDLIMEEQIMTLPKIQELSTDEQRNEPVCPDSQSTISDELLPSLNAYSRGQEAHLNEYINEFRMYDVVPSHTVKDIYIPINIKEKHHWVLAVLSFSERCIFLYDSYESYDHHSVVLTEIEKLAEIILLCLQACDFYDKKGINLQNHPRYKDKDSSDMFDILFEKNLPQKPSESLDYGLYMVTYTECLSYGHNILSNEFDPNALHTRYVALLWTYGTRNKKQMFIVTLKHL
ncbi:hypothetical protein BC332_07314 [Capsicum chinense]|nr:hypothetical protein BC332_07314 [Capsicum chinense]